MSRSTSPIRPTCEGRRLDDRWRRRAPSPLGAELRDRRRCPPTRECRRHRPTTISGSCEPRRSTAAGNTGVASGPPLPAAATTTTLGSQALQRLDDDFRGHGLVGVPRERQIDQRHLGRRIRGWRWRRLRPPTFRTARRVTPSSASSRTVLPRRSHLRQRCRDRRNFRGQRGSASSMSVVNGDATSQEVVQTRSANHDTGVDDADIRSSWVHRAVHDVHVEDEVTGRNPPRGRSVRVPGADGSPRRRRATRRTAGAEMSWDGSFRAGSDITTLTMLSHPIQIQPPTGERDDGTRAGEPGR